MKKPLLLTFAVLLLTFAAYSQSSFETGISLGATNYFGDLGNEPWVQTGSTSPGIAVTFRNFSGSNTVGGYRYHPLSWEVRLSWNRLQYDETKPIGNQQGFELRNYGRGIGFRNDLFGIATHVTYTIYENPRAPLHHQHAAFFVFTGIGAYYGKPMADLFRGSIDLNNRYYFWPDGTIRDGAYQNGNSQANIIEKDGDYETDLSDWMTEGGTYKGEHAKNKAYNFINVGFPLGCGIRWGLSEKITMSAEFGYYFFTTDFLDDVSDQYPTAAEINANFPNDPVKQALALYITDPTGWGTTGYPGPATSRRGNPAKKDSFSFISLEVAYRFDLKKELPRIWGRK
ncbi:MAG TPA: hypothetical protein VFW78_12370 [Bacteroidia bacterium]|nr:hypothetical protein [Bacteroidia bacterium]